MQLAHKGYYPTPKPALGDTKHMSRDATLTVLGIDPGETTGWATITVPRLSIFGTEPGRIVDFETGELYGDEFLQVRDLARMSRQLGGLSGPFPAICCEGYRPGLTKSTGQEVLAPVRLAAAIRYAVYAGHFGDVCMPPDMLPAFAKEAAPDDRLEAWGIYTAGPDHIRDATRQAIVGIRRAKTNAKYRDECWR